MYFKLCDVLRGLTGCFSRSHLIWIYTVLPDLFDHMVTCIMIMVKDNLKYKSVIQVGHYVNMPMKYNAGFSLIQDLGSQTPKMLSETP